MITNVRVLGYAVSGYDSVLKVPYVTGLEPTLARARKTLNRILTNDSSLTPEQKARLRVVRFTEVMEEI